jgi:uncharacterized protein (DUF433 family)
VGSRDDNRRVHGGEAMINENYLFLHESTSVLYIETMNSKDLHGIIHSDPEIMGNTPVFVGTRVPLQNLIDYLEGGTSVDEFLGAFPAVKREQVIAVIEARG